MWPTISVVIPVHNRFQFLGEALHSVFSQTHRPDEVILVDDCSTESLTDYLAQKPPAGEVKVLRTDRNLRVAGARNWGWRHAKGELIAFLDSDDVWPPDKTERQLKYLEANPLADGVYGSMQAFWPDGRTEIWASNRPPVVDVRHALLDASITVQTLLIRRATLETLNGFDERFGILDDQEIAIRMAKSGLHVSFFAEPPLVRHRRNRLNYSSHGFTYFREQVRILAENRDLCNRTFGPGSHRVHLGRALRLLSHASRIARYPSRILARLLYSTAPSSTMPTELWKFPKPQTFIQAGE